MHFTAWGKLYIAGEYAVVEPGEPAIIVGINRGITATVSATQNTAAGTSTINSAHYGSQPRILHSNETEFGPQIAFADGSPDYVTAALTICEQYRALRGISPRSYNITLASELVNTQGLKYGLGSSGAVVCALVAGLTDFYKLNLTADQQLRLALLASCLQSVRGSGGDLAASMLGGWVFYQSPDRVRLLADYKRGGLAMALQSTGWDTYKAETVEPALSLKLLVGWTGSPADTEHLVQKTTVAKSKKADDKFAAEFLAENRANVLALRVALENGESEKVAAAIRNARDLLWRYSEHTAVEIETTQLQLLCEAAEQLTVAAKTSGAGGGDCGIALTTDDELAAAVKAAWRTAGIKVLDLEVTPTRGSSAK